ncbi:MAG: hypothetical protein ACFFF9_06055 [Candidatus Thorarchaeota archaeon]
MLIHNPAEYKSGFCQTYYLDGLFCRSESTESKSFTLDVATGLQWNLGNIEPSESKSVDIVLTSATNLEEVKTLIPPRLESVQQEDAMMLDRKAQQLPQSVGKPPELFVDDLSKKKGEGTLSPPCTRELSLGIPPAFGLHPSKRQTVPYC